MRYHHGKVVHRIFFWKDGPRAKIGWYTGANSTCWLRNRDALLCRCQLCAFPVLLLCCNLVEFLCLLKLPLIHVWLPAQFNVMTKESAQCCLDVVLPLSPLGLRSIWTRKLLQNLGNGGKGRLRTLLLQNMKHKRIVRLLTNFVYWLTLYLRTSSSIPKTTTRMKQLSKSSTTYSRRHQIKSLLVDTYWQAASNKVVSSYRNSCKPNKSWVKTVNWKYHFWWTISKNYPEMPV